jgi:hypothetical protein
MKEGGDGSSRIIDRAVTLLPLPDSPTIPNVSPLLTSKLTPRTASNSSSRDINDTRKLLTFKIGSNVSPPTKSYFLKKLPFN